MAPDLAMSDTLVRNATWFADTPAYVADGRALSHAQLYARAARLASALAAHGVRRQDRVSVLGRNSIEFGEVLAAGQLSGIIIATVNFRLASPGIASIVADASPRVLIADAEYLPLVAEYRARFPSVELVIGIGSPTIHDVVGYEDFLASASAAPITGPTLAQAMRSMPDAGPAEFVRADRGNLHRPAPRAPRSGRG